MQKIKVGNCILIQADCFEIFPKLKDQSVDLIHTDPPYEIKCSKKQLGKIGDYSETRLGATFEKLAKANISSGFEIHKFFEDTKNILKVINYQIWCSKKQFPELLKLALENKWGWQDICLYRNNALPVCYHKYLDKDYCLHFFKGRPISGKYEHKQIGYWWNIGKKPAEINHPALKPVEPILNLLETGSTEGDTVLDPFMGSGTTGIACIRKNRKFIGIEKNPEFFEMAVNRIKTEVNNKV